MRLVDAHNHLHTERLAAHIDDALSECKRLGVVAGVVNGTSPADWGAVADITSRNRWLIPAYGCHPWFLDNLPADWEERLKRALDERPAAVGEIGLDGWKPDIDARLQEEIFSRQLEIASERNLPVTIHGLKSWDRLYGLLKNGKRPAAGFLLHSYSGPLHLAQKFADLGAYFSCSCAFLADSRRAKLAIFKELPVERILPETDAPDQLPPREIDRYHITDDYGERITHPASISAVYSGLAVLLELSEETLQAKLEANFYRLFGSVASTAC